MYFPSPDSQQRDNPVHLRKRHFNATSGAPIVPVDGRVVAACPQHGRCAPPVWKDVVVVSVNPKKPGQRYGKLPAEDRHRLFSQTKLLVTICRADLTNTGI